MRQDSVCVCVCVSEEGRGESGVSLGGDATADVDDAIENVADHWF